MTNEELEQIIKSNQITLARLEEKVTKIHKYMFWARVGGIVKIVLILAPIIIGIMYLTPYLKQMVGSFEPLFNTLKIYTGNIENIDNTNQSNQPDNNQVQNNVPTDMLKDFCDPEIREIYVRNLCK